MDGRATVVGLNLFPPSSDVYANSWSAATDGAQLMANALQFAADNAGTPVTSDLRGWASGVCGGLVHLHSGFGTPGSNAWFVAGDPGGQVTIPQGPCAGAVVPLRRLRYLGRLPADGGGNAELATFPSVCGSPAVVFDQASCTASAPFLLP